MKSVKKVSPSSFSNWSIPSVSQAVQLNQKKGQGLVFIVGRENKASVKQIIQKHSLPWQKNQLLTQAKEVYQFMSSQGPIWILAPSEKNSAVSHQGLLEESSYVWIRDQVGSLFSVFKAHGLKSVHFELQNIDDQQEFGFWMGLELSNYNYKQILEPSIDAVQISVIKMTGQKKQKISSELINQAVAVGRATNIARHMVNLPPNILNPTTFADWVRKKFSNSKTIKLEIWDEKKLQAENMNLHLAVGRGAEHPPCLIHLRYRSKKANSKAPIAFVGKGITFDSGGLDIKPSSGMRLMKKDMGGAAAVLGLAVWAEETQFDRDLDFYIALAENSVDARSFRPSDVLTARNGIKVEIHNTDAEGRLVLADAIDVAVSQTGKDEPIAVINIATLTGAIKVALGSQIAGLFSNHDALADEINRTGVEAGDINWRMPLYAPYTAQFSSPFADMVNAVDGFGGAITAALFLEKFTKRKPWAHLDIYAWADKASGAIASSGGNGQSVQGLIRFLQKTQF